MPCPGRGVGGRVPLQAMWVADEIDALLSDGVLRSHFLMPIHFEANLATKLMVLVRFGEWDAILDVPFKADAELYKTHTLFLHWARGIALGVRGELSAAREEQTKFTVLLSGLAPKDRMKHNTNVAEHMGPIGAAILEGELSYREGKYNECWEALESSVALYDAMPYDEPAGYMMSPRQTFGALLVEQQLHARAVPLYEADLQAFPKNVFSLAGLHACLKAGNGSDASRLAEIAYLGAALKEARSLADVPIGASCACARDFNVTG